MSTHPSFIDSSLRSGRKVEEKLLKCVFDIDLALLNEFKSELTQLVHFHRGENHKKTDQYVKLI